MIVGQNQSGSRKIIIIKTEDPATTAKVNQIVTDSPILLPLRKEYLIVTLNVKKFRFEQPEEFCKRAKAYMKLLMSQSEKKVDPYVR